MPALDRLSMPPHTPSALASIINAGPTKCFSQCALNIGCSFRKPVIKSHCDTLLRKQSALLAETEHCVYDLEFHARYEHQGRLALMSSRKGNIVQAIEQPEGLRNNSIHKTTTVGLKRDRE
eukprot:6200597-Pleurochrysis_carterae.AAC.4